jgi:hypothetical protein
MPIDETVVSAQPLPYKLVNIEFDDKLRYNTTSQTVYREMDPSLPLYFGEPDPKIDAAWSELLQYEYPAVSAKEISQNPSLQFSLKDHHPVTGKYHIALDVFHSLHCLNMVRMELDKDYYGQHDHGHVDRDTPHKHGRQSSFDAAQRDHIDHCMNHIRQNLQCRPDLSAAAMHVFDDQDGSKFFLGNSGTHSCYDWNSILKWAGQRELGYTTPVS